MTIYFLLPFFRPQRCGVSDHSSVLAKRFRDSFGVSSVLLTVRDCEPPPNGTFSDHRSVNGLENPRALLEALGNYSLGENDAVLVQVSLYGYQKRAVPFNLVEALRLLRREKPRLKIGMFFHELWAVSGRPWTSSFWLSGMQRGICGQLAALSDVNFCNRLSSAKWVQTQGGAMTWFVPTFSNIGEPSEIPEWSARENAIVVFGTAGTRAVVYRQHFSRLQEVMHSLGCERLIDIGPPGAHTKALNRLGASYVVEGQLTPEHICRRLSSAKYGVFETVWSAVTKSGVFAALTAHGVVPLGVRAAPDNYYGPASQPAHGKHFLTLYDRLESIEQHQYHAISSSAFAWYRSHDSLSAAGLLLEGLRTSECRARPARALKSSALLGVRT